MSDQLSSHNVLENIFHDWCYLKFAWLKTQSVPDYACPQMYPTHPASTLLSVGNARLCWTGPPVGTTMHPYRAMLSSTWHSSTLMTGKMQRTRSPPPRQHTQWVSHGVPPPQVVKSTAAAQLSGPTRPSHLPNPMLLSPVLTHTLTAPCAPSQHALRQLSHHFFLYCTHFSLTHTLASSDTITNSSFEYFWVKPCFKLNWVFHIVGLFWFS